jgi:VWFA-related protein
LQSKLDKPLPEGIQRMPNSPRLRCLILATLLSAAAASTQQTPQPTAPTGNQILLDVVVAPKSGPPVGDLTQQDFTLLDNKAPQAITSFKAVPGREAPIEVLLVIDAVNATARTIALERSNIDKVLRAEGGRLAYRLAIAIFGDKGTQILGGGFSTDGNAIAAQLDQNEIGLRDLGRSAGFNGAAERWQLSLKTLSQLVANLAPRPGRKLILWVSPGWPLLSGPNVDLDAKLQAMMFGHIVNLSTQLRQARVTLYSVDPLGNSESVGRASFYQAFVKGVSKPSQIEAGDLGLPVIATQSGGLALNFNNDVAALLRECIADAAPYYEISFVAAPAERPDEYHSLEVKIATPGLTARTRQGYYAQPGPRN